MSIALMQLFEPSIIDLIYDFIPMDEDEDEWETLYGFTEIYETQHYLTYVGGPEGGYVFFYREREQGWYRWSRTWGQGPTYERITSGQVAIRHRQDEDEKITVLPDNWDELGYGDDDDIMIMDNSFMIQQDWERIASARSRR